MRSTRLFVQASLALMLVVASCQHPHEVVDLSANSNLLLNGSFELQGNPSLLGWNPTDPDSNLVRFSTDVPINGGRYSLRLETVWGPRIALSSAVPAVPGMHSYRLSSWAKRSGPGGDMVLSHQSKDTSITYGVTTIQDSSWTFYALVGTIFAQPGDSLTVTVTGGFSHLLRGTTWFDLCRLEALY